MLSCAGMLLLTLGGCASAPEAPSNLFSRAEMLIETAEEAEAGRQAPVAMRAAQTQLNEARRALRAESHTDATRALEKAIANADYALMKSRREKTEEAATEVQQALQELREQLPPSQSLAPPQSQAGGQPQADG